MSSSDAPQPTPNLPAKRGSRSFLRRVDQGAVAAITLVALIVLGMYEWRQWRGSRGVIEIDRAEPRIAEFKVDINQAEWPEVAQIPELGETLARRLVENRLAHGPFRDYADVRNRVKGIGPKTIEKIAPYLQPISPKHIAAKSSGTVADE